MLSYLGSPVLPLTDVDVNNWVHFMEHTSSVVLEITIHQVKSKMSIQMHAHLSLAQRELLTK